MTWTGLVLLGLTPPIVLAQASPAADSSLVGLLTGSAVTVLAAAVIAFLKGWLVPGKEHQRVIEERDRAIAANEKRAEEDRRLLIPVLTELGKAQAQAISQRLGVTEMKET